MSEPTGDTLAELPPRSDERATPGVDVGGEDTSRLLLPLSTPLSNAADVAFDRIAGVVRTVIDVPVALVSLVDRNRQVFPGAVGLPEPWQTDRQTPLSHSFCQHVVARANPLVITDARTDPTLSSNLAIPDLGVVAYAGMPLHDAAGRVVGSLCAVDTEPRDWTASELALLSDLAQTCSAELQLRSAADTAEHAAARTRLLLELSEVVSSATTVGQVGRLVSSLATKRLGASFGGITMLDVHAGTLQYLHLDGFTDEVRLNGTFGVGADLPSALVARTGRPLFLHTLDELGTVTPGALDAARATGATSFAYLPLQLGGDVIGTLSLTWTAGQPFTADDRELLIGFARYVAGALDRAGLLADRRDVAATLQRAMLPTLPVVPWLEIEGVYRPANAADAVGGDWYDAFLTTPRDNDVVGSPSGDASPLTVVVGDVTGHDTAAAAVMGRLQSGLRHLAIDAPCAPAALLGRLDRVMGSHATLAGDRMATAVTAHVMPPGTTPPDDEPGSVELTWSNAGHLPPLMLSPGREPTFLDVPVDLLLGLDPTAARRDHVVRLPPGTTVLLFTDGLVERRDADLDNGLDALAYAADIHRHLPLREMLDAVVDAALAGTHDDDTLVLGLRVPLG